MKTIVIAALTLLAISVGFGIWTGIAGHPYSTVLFTVHKLSGVGFIVLSVLFYVREIKAGGLVGGQFLLPVLFVASAVGLLAAGIIMSIKQPSMLLRIVHASASGILSVSAGIRLISYLIG